MRRVLAAISNIWTPATSPPRQSDIVAQIRELVQGRNVAPLKEGPKTSNASATNAKLIHHLHGK